MPGESGDPAAPPRAGDPATGGKADARATREAKLAEALRTNLRRRKGSPGKA
jgi:hypothetical protein